MFLLQIQYVLAILWRLYTFFIEELWKLKAWWFLLQKNHSLTMGFCSKSVPNQFPTKWYFFCVCVCLCGILIAIWITTKYSVPFNLLSYDAADWIICLCLQSFCKHLFFFILHIITSLTLH